MSFNLLDTVKGLFTPGLISTTASSLGESEGGIQKALSGAIPSILAGLIGKAGSTSDATGILQLAKQAAGSGLLTNISGFFEGDNNNFIGQGAEMLKNILGDKAGGIASLVSNFAGIKHSSASSILSMAAPVSLGVVGNHAIDNNLDAGGLMSFFASQKNSILNALPAGLSAVTGLLGLHSTSSSAHAANDAHATAYHAEHAEETNTGSLKFLLPLLLGVLAVALSIYLFKGCTGAPKAEAVATESNAMKPAETEKMPAAAASTEREMLKVKLPNDTVLDAYKGGIEDRLVTFLKTDYKKLGEDSLKKTWFDFDNLNFKTSSAEITEESQKQVNNLAAILKAFPAAKIKIGGYTDKTGDEGNNKKLSDARAKAVQAALTKAGVSSQVTGAEGYGSALAVYPANAPESDRVKDRRVSVSVR